MKRGWSLTLKLIGLYQRNQYKEKKSKTKPTTVQMTSQSLTQPMDPFMCSFLKFWGRGSKRARLFNKSKFESNLVSISGITYYTGSSASQK